MAASVARCGSVDRTRAGKCERRILFSAIRYSFCSRSCWFTIPVTYANSRATCVFFIETHHHIRAMFSMDSDSLTLRGEYGFIAVTPGTYRLDVKAPGLVGSQRVAVVSGKSVDVTVELKIEVVKQSATVTAKDAALSRESSDETVISRSTVLIAPNKYDRFDALLPLIPGVVRGPDGLISMKGARSSQGGSLVNSASVTDPATGNAAMSLPIDVVQSVRVIPNPYDPEYGRLAGAVSSVETVTSNFNAFHLSVQNLL